MAETYEHYAAGLESPASHGFDIVPDDTTPLPSPTRALYIGHGGQLCLTLLSGATVTFQNIPAGCLLPVRATRVFSTRTTVTGIIGLG
ncbi:hypothetical protein AGRHK599_LOCUS4103 [Rhizobium rhizogenes]|uniref:Uncharacterized protein n=2 Tax=Rhizobium/Agrobacterium group TaxID=227290 RepID=A0A546XUD3_AGRTU|nr:MULTISPECIES: hypothetical protein [Rhizobium/Agrobacterium group]AQS64139.1 hypothetical protein B0909_17660 [Rhizobium rhizogenes]MBO0128669.1 hypothetical protein [Agrobacterium sp. OT33]MCZ7445134.1 hypothetical protein [Rhizobium rhizogenes]NSX93272.1 hypothetical protein [Agrobacterium tumefaciens]NSZ81494.1 hypothetical protein [Agrobacterium tumefaciens]